MGASRELSELASLVSVSSGAVGIGTTPSAWSGTVALELPANGMISTKGGGTYLLSNAYFDGSFKYSTTAAATAIVLGSNGTTFQYAPSGTVGNVISFATHARIDTSGNLLVGKTTASATTVGVQLESNGASAFTRSSSSNSDLNLYVYSTGAGAARFYVGMGGTVFATNTTISAISDQRFKENIEDLDVGLSAVMSLKPRKFDWKEGKGKDIKGDRGFIAQELEQVFPDLVDEWADPAPEGEEPYKSVRQDLIPVLVKAIQEQQALITALTTRITALENK